MESGGNPNPAVDWDKFFRGDIKVKDIGPFFRDSGLAQRVAATGTPFGLPVQYEFDWQGFKDWCWEHSFEIGMAFLFMGSVYTARQHPDILPQLSDSVANMIKGIGEVIPG